MKAKVVLYCLLGGLPMLIAAMGAGHAGWWLLSGVVMAAAFVPVALFGPRSLLGQLAVIAPVLFIVTAFCTWTEAMVFAPSFRQHAARNLVGSTVTYLIVAVLLAGLAAGLKMTRQSDEAVPHRSIPTAILMVLAGGIAYAIYYLIFGAITYQFFTKGYYPEAKQIARQLGLWFWAMQIGRGALMTLAVLPVIYTLRMNRWQTAIVVGLLIWVAGGLAPLLPPNDMMVARQRVIHIVEIFTQNAALGFTVALWLRPKTADGTGHLARPAAARV